MISRDEAKQIILESFEEQALVIGGLVAVHKVDDDLVWRLMKSFDVILGKAIKRLHLEPSEQDKEATPGRVNAKPHPAIEEFLLKLERES
ncbi:MAG: hypothetical protein KCHDKBKB_02436 [Elusimicrobia bacterium]|nr:hypothetical protein [Elusimicrobiota bacterium]